MPIRILHTADWQLGKQFGGFRAPADAGALLRRQRLQTVRRIAELARERSVDAVLVAGDIFDHRLVSQGTIAGLTQALQRFGGDWVLLPGNHDCAGEGSVWEQLQRQGLTGQIHLALDARPIVLAGGALAVLPAPLRRKHEARDLTESWDGIASPTGARRVGLAHGTVTGELPEREEQHNPIARDRATSARLDYLALGDWHGLKRIDERTWYSGTPEPDRFKANSSGNVLLVELYEPGEPPRVEAIPVSHYQWREHAATLTSSGDLQQLQQTADAWSPPEQQVVRLVLDGELALAPMGELDDALAGWEGLFAGLDVDRGGLRTHPGAEEFESLLPPGFVAQAVEILRGQEGAEAALQILYRLCRAHEVRP